MNAQILSSVPSEPALDREDLPSSDRQSTRTTSQVQLNPAEIQKVIVEHIVKSEVASAIPSTTVIKLRPFSGRIPQPSNESDYDTWCCNVELLLDDPSVSDLQRVRRIMESVLPPATDIKSLEPSASERASLNMLDSAYGAIEDGDELFSKFMNTFQNDGEKASSYLQRLQVALSKAVRGGEIKSTETNHQLLWQFCRGCWDEILISELHLDTRRNDPIEFQDLLQSTKPAHVYSHDTAIVSKFPPESRLLSETAELKKQISELKEQLTSLTFPKSRKTDKPKHKNVHSPITHESVAKQPVKSTGGPVTKCSPRPGYCFRCGEDSHISVVCMNPPNSKLVEKKRDELRLKQRFFKCLTVPVARQTGAGQTESRPNGKHSKGNCKFEAHPRLSIQCFVGSKCTAQVTISGTECHCLLDTGSQVTTVPWSFYQAWLTNHPIESLNHLLEVSGANGQPVPYKGYIEIPITFPEVS